MIRSVLRSPFSRVVWLASVLLAITSAYCLLPTAYSSPAYSAPVPVSPDEVVRGDPERPWVSLVVNAGAGYGPAGEMLDTLAAKGLRTTFFLMGWWAERNPEL